VQKELMQQAADAGADMVWPRSRFSAELPTLLQQFGLGPPLSPQVQTVKSRKTSRVARGMGEYTFY
jgi:hypothetical protein